MAGWAKGPPSKYRPTGPKSTAVNGDRSGCPELARTIGGAQRPPAPRVKLNVFAQGPRTPGQTLYARAELPNTRCENQHRQESTANNQEAAAVDVSEKLWSGPRRPPISPRARPRGKELASWSTEVPRSEELRPRRRGFKEVGILIPRGVGGKNRPPMPGTCAMLVDCGPTRRRTDNKNSVLMRVKSGGQPRFRRGAYRPKPDATEFKMESVRGNSPPPPRRRLPRGSCQKPRSPSQVTFPGGICPPPSGGKRSMAVEVPSFTAPASFPRSGVAKIARLHS